MIRSKRCSVNITCSIIFGWLIVTKEEYVTAHSRWGCPKPRDPDTGIKDGPCGFVVSSAANETIMEVPPGPMLVRWEEAVAHTGSPFRISLSGENTNDSDACVLLDHIPHNDESYPISDIESTYTNYSMIIDIPNVFCERCSLHLANPMTDKEGLKGAPYGKGCTDPMGDCILVYYSCTIPIRINGTIPRSEYVCPNRNPIDWPTTWMGDSGITVNATQMGLYRRESGKWDDQWLTSVPPRYRTVNDDVFTCENFVSQVERRGGLIPRIFSGYLSWLLKLFNLNR